MARLMGSLLCGLIAAGTAPASAGVPGDCPPLGPLPGYETIDAPHRLPYDGVGFATGAGAQATEAGHACRQTYHPISAHQALSPAQIMAGYRPILEKLGARITASSDQETDASLEKGGEALWLKLASRPDGVAVTVIEVAPFQQVLTHPSGHDWHLLGHISGYLADPPDRQAQGQLTLTVKEGGSPRQITVEGARTAIHYTWIDGQIERSSLDIETNYRNALKTLGAEILAEDEHGTVARLDDHGRTAWVQITDEGTAVDVTVIEEAPGKRS